MFSTLRNAFKIKELRQKLLFTFLMLVVIRLGSSLPIPGVNTNYFREFFAKQSGDAFGFFNAMTGGSFEQMSVLALSITPYITSSIIIQLLTIAVPALEEMQRDGEDGRKKIVAYTRYVTVALGLIESVAMSIGFGKQGLLIHYGPKSVIVAVCTMTAGSAFLMWIGERITDKGVGNGISIVLLFNILSSIPQDLGTLYTKFLSGKSMAMKVVLGLVIFASSLMSFPVVIAQFANINYATPAGKILRLLSTSSWFNKEVGYIYSLGALVYVILVVLFAYFYTSITFNPLEVANNMKKQGGVIPGVRPGKPTSDYLNKILNYIIFIGAAGLLVVAIIPIIISGVFSVSKLSFTGTSLIIIVGVVLETIKAIESQMLVRNYKGFLMD